MEHRYICKKSINNNNASNGCTDNIHLSHVDTDDSNNKNPATAMQLLDILPTSTQIAATTPETAVE
jgi:hypothetical protein